MPKDNVKTSSWFQAPKPFKVQNQTKMYLHCFLAFFFKCNAPSTKSLRFGYLDAQTPTAKKFWSPKSCRGVLRPPPHPLSPGVKPPRGDPVSSPSNAAWFPLIPQWTFSSRPWRPSDRSQRAPSDLVDAPFPAAHVTVPVSGGLPQSTTTPIAKALLLSRGDPIPLRYPTSSNQKSNFHINASRAY